MEIKRFEIYLVNLDPTSSTEIQKTRPCLIISPDEMNRHISTVIIAPMTTKGHAYPSRVPCKFDGKEGQIVLDQIRAVDKVRLVKKLGHLIKTQEGLVLSVLGEMFAEAATILSPGQVILKSEKVIADCPDETASAPVTPSSAEYIGTVRAPVAGSAVSCPACKAIVSG